MRKILSLSIALMIIISAVGCQEAATGDIDEGPAVGDSILIQIEPVDPLALSKENQQELESRRTEAGHYLFEEEGTTYLAVFSGERNTGGYSIEIAEITLQDNKLSVSTVETAPDPDMMVTQALTYPMAVVSLADLENIEQMVIHIELESSGTQADNNHYISPTDEIPVGEIITVGKIMQFDGKYIHIISGDLVEVFEYDTSQALEFYLGQTVQLVKGEGVNTLEPFIIEDFSQLYTNMGDIIHTVEGEITSITDEYIIIESDGQEVSITSYSEVLVQVGDQVEAHYINRGEEEFGLIGIYRDVARMEMIVRELVRGEDGSLIIYTSDKGSENVDYHISIAGALLELNISELSTDDTIFVYADIIMESYPAQVIATRVLK